MYFIVHSLTTSIIVLASINPLVHSVQYIGRLAKILILILEGIVKKIPMSVATMSR